MLKVSNVCLNLGETNVLKNISFQCSEGEILTILGPSGAGKSSILKSVAGLLEPHQGTIELMGKDVTKMPAHHRKAAYVSQEPSLFSHMTVAENLCFGMDIQGVSQNAKSQRLQELLSLLELEPYEHRMPHQLSGGQKQRVALGRALAIKPDALLLDEPFSSLDFSLRAAMGTLVYRIRDLFRVAILMVTHDPMESMALSDQLILLKEGQIVQQGDPKSLYRYPKNFAAASMLGAWGVLPCTESQGILKTPVGNFSASEMGLVEGQLIYRPGDVFLVSSEDGFVIEDIKKTGLETRYMLETNDGAIEITTLDPVPLSKGEVVQVIWKTFKNSQKVTV